MHDHDTLNVDRREFFKTATAGLTAAGLMLTPRERALAQAQEEKNRLDRIAACSYPIRYIFKSRAGGGRGAGAGAGGGAGRGGATGQPAPATQARAQTPPQQAAPAAQAQAATQAPATTAAPAAQAQAAAAPAATAEPVRAATAADFRAGVQVRDQAGGVVGTVESADASGAVVSTGTIRARLPLTSFGANGQGLVISMTRGQLEAAAAQARPQPGAS